MKTSKAVNDGSGLVLDFVLENFKDDPEKRVKLYRKIGLDLIELSNYMQFEREHGH